MKNKKTALINWSTLSDIPTDDDDCIEEEFLHFDVGANKFTIWQWFEEEYDCSVVESLCGTEYN